MKSQARILPSWPGHLFPSPLEGEGSRVWPEASVLVAALTAVAILAAAPTTSEAQTTSSWTTFEPHANAADPPLIQRGQRVFQARCNLCHGATTRDAGPGTGAWMAGTQALEARYKGSKPAMLEQRTDLTPDMVRYFVRHGSGVMPFFRKTEVSDADLDALAAYLSRKRR